MIISIENMQASAYHHWIMFLRYYEKANNAVFCCQFCKTWAPLSIIRRALCFFIVFQLEMMLLIVI
jgi:hypothetical protein